MMRDETFGFLVAGHDTTGAVMQWTLRWLTAEQRVQTKIRSELRSVLDSRGDDQALSAEIICKAKVSTSAAVSPSVEEACPLTIRLSCHTSMP
jgi:cytochrome P450